MRDIDCLYHCLLNRTEWSHKRDSPEKGNVHLSQCWDDIYSVIYTTATSKTRHTLHAKRQGLQLVRRSLVFLNGREAALVDSSSTPGWNNLQSTDLCCCYVTRVLLGGGWRKLPFPFRLEENAASWKAGGLLQIWTRSIHSSTIHSWVCGSFRWEKGEMDQTGIPWVHKEVLCDIHKAKSHHDG